MTADAIADLDNVVRIYRSASGEVPALRGIDVTFRPGSVTAIAGPSGGGKSTLLSIISLRDRASSGSVSVSGIAVNDLSQRGLNALRRRTIAWVPQRPAHGLWPHLTAWENVEQVRRLRIRSRRARRGGGPDASTTGDALTAADALDRLGLGDLREARPGRLSGGEQQRLAVATALVGAPLLLVADEPTAELDDDNAEQLLAALLEQAARGTTCVLSTHDDRALRVLPRVLHLRQGVLSAERGPAAGHPGHAGPGGIAPDGSTDPSRQAELEAVIDGAGRIQLSREALRLFPGRRVRMQVTGGEVRLVPPPEDTP